MALPSVTVNYVAVVGAAVVSFIIGMLWYSPLLFGNAWMKAGGFSKKDINKAKKKGSMDLLQWLSRLLHLRF